MASPVKMNPALQLAVRNAACADCRMAREVDSERDVCITGVGPTHPDVVVVTKLPASGKAIREIGEYLAEVGFDPAKVMYLSAIKCRTWTIDPNKTDQKACKHYLDAELEFLKPAWVLAMGNEALTATVGRSGIMKYRGGTFIHPSGANVFATISTAMVARNPGLRAGFIGDLRYFRAHVEGIPTRDDDRPKTYHVVNTKDDLRAFAEALSNAEYMSVDIESTIHDLMEFDPDARIISLAATLWTGDGEPVAWALPLYHPESPWRSVWQRVLAVIGKYLRKPKKVIAHNGKFDCRWLVQFGVNIKVTFDTILALHLLNENAQKGLKPAAQQMLGAEPWGINTKDLLTTPLDEVLEYNMLDTWNTARLYHVLKAELLKNPRLVKLFTRLMMPAQRELVWVERAGVWVDVEVLMTNWHQAKTELADVEEKLREWVPDDHPFITYDRHGTVKSDGVNFNPSNFLRWWLFEYLELPILGRGKEKDDGSPGAPSCAEAIMMELAELHEVPVLLLQRSKWFKYCSSFFSAYQSQLDKDHRVHTTFKLSNTVTGRLASGKADAEKITAKRQVRGVNLQQVPRDVLVRGVFGAPPGWWFVQSDFSQIELRIAAYLARERNMLHHYATGQDLHMAMAMRMTGKPASQITYEERKHAKPVNFGFLYGMSWKKFILTAWQNYGVRFDEESAKAARNAFFEMWPDLRKWHNKQRALVRKFGRVESPMGRIRHLPDINSPNPEVQAEAERQAINSPVQAFASDLALLALILLCQEFRKRAMRSRVIGTVHDAVNFEIPDEEMAEALPLIKDTMQNLPIEELFGVVLDIPIIADISVGTHWGGAKELKEEEVYSWTSTLLTVAR